MCKKKLLSAAIGTALAMGAGVSYAGTFEVTLPSTTVPVYASEAIGTSGNQIISNSFTVKYTLNPTSLDTNLYVNFTLNGAVWQESLNSAALTNNNSLKPSISIVKDGEAGQSSAQYLIEANSTDTLDQANPLELTFKIADFYQMSSPGNEVSLTIAITSAASGNTADTTESETIAKSAAAVTMEVLEDDQNTRSAIDVAQGSTVFIESVNDTTVSLGTIKLGKSPDAVKGLDGGTYEFDAIAGQLTVLNGMFAASLATPNSVYINLSGAVADFDTGDLAATTLDATTATWTFSPTQLEDLYNNGQPHEIVIKADGVTVINDNTDAPSGTLLIEFETDQITSGALKHVERNGTTCTLYNIPAAGAIDLLNIRVTNNSASKTGIVLGSLWDKDGNALFTNQTLVAELAPLNTTRLTADNLVTALTESGSTLTTWAGRAILVLSSDLTDMEAFNLLRNSAGGPLLNMSVGGTGNSCD